jgi:chromatin segregation and condensation protein Rec8/ScpA/Scc1 (kleisin family)
LAILELVRLKEIKAVQRQNFDTIEIFRSTENMIPSQENFETEFPAQEERDVQNG